MQRSNIHPLFQGLLQPVAPLQPDATADAVCAFHPTRWVLGDDGRIMDRNGPFWMTPTHAMRRLPQLAEMAALFSGAMRDQAFRDASDLLDVISQATVHGAATAANVVACGQGGEAA